MNGASATFVDLRNILNVLLPYFTFIYYSSLITSLRCILIDHIYIYNIHGFHAVLFKNKNIFLMLYIHTYILVKFVYADI